MPISASWARSAWFALLVCAAAALALAVPRAQTTDVQIILSHVGERVAEYYKHVQNIVCNEKSTVQPLSNTMSFATGAFARITESELRIESDQAGDGDTPSEATFVRKLLRVNGRPAREKDRTDAAGCTDPNPLTPEPLAFLLPANRGEYTFTFGGFGKGKDSGALIVDFASGQGRDGKLLDDPNGRPDCFGWELPARVKGRVWIDATTFDILRVEEHMVGTGSVRVSPEQQRKHNLPDWITVDRYDKTIRLKKASFKDPDETVLLPESIEQVILIRNALQSTRREQRFTDYRRFLTTGRIVK